MMMSSATAVGQTIVVLAAPILTRLYSPGDFGVLGVYASTLGIFSVVASLRYEQAIPLPKYEHVAFNLLGIAMIVVALVSLSLGAVAMLFATEIANFTNTPEYQFVVYLVPIGVALAGTYQVLSYWAVRQQAYKQIARTTLIQGAGLVTVQLGLGMFSAGAPGLIAGQIIGRSAGITNLMSVIRRGSIRPLAVISIRRLKYVARRYRNFPLNFTWSALLNSIVLMGPTVALASMYGVAVAGWYALVQRVLGVPTTLLGRSVTNVFFSESARLARDAPDQLQQLFTKKLKKLVQIGCLTIIPVGLISPWVFPFVFGSEWASAGRYAMILSPMVLLQFITSPFGVTLTVLERQDLALLREILRVALIASALASGALLGLTPECALILLSLAGIASYMLHLGMSWLAIRQRAKELGITAEF
jgi:O-antigen/teichoic acid export membrane protein